MIELSIEGKLLWQLWIVSGVCYCMIQILLTHAWNRLPLHHRHKKAPTPFSVIIAAQNEAGNLTAFLPDVLNQNYPQYEVIVVLDRSQDESLTVLKDFQLTYPHLRYIDVQQLPNDWQGKKWALACGIHAAYHPVIALIDADCQPPSTWLTSINQHLDPNTSVIIGIGKYFERPGLLNLIIQLETAYTAFQYIGAACLGYPYMAVGRNLAYRKSFYQQYEGFSKFKERLSGDDDLLINRFANPNHTRPMITSDSFTYSQPHTSWNLWIKQKWRHVSASPAYTPFSKFLLSAFHLSHICFYLLFFVLLLFKKNIILLGTIFGIKIVLGWICMAIFLKKYSQLSLLKYYPLLDVFIFLYNLFIVPVGIIKKPEWK